MAQPNVLLICVDHWPGQLLGIRDHEHILTPTLNQLATNGVLFTEAYTTTPTCIPARRALMTGTMAKTHGDRSFNEHLEMDPNLTTMPTAFRAAGYQAYAVGKLHVYPQRNRIGFEDVILNEEGRHQFGNLLDDYERFLREEGYSGQEFTHAMGSNEYCVRPWHLPERYHSTNWTTREMCRTIQRRDPTRPSFWYCSYQAPHPPIVPPAEYLEIYRHLGVDEPFIGDWAKNYDKLPYALKSHSSRWHSLTKSEISEARAGFYAQCTYIDHQIRLLIGTLREEELLDNTTIMFISDHGDMLGNHNLWAKTQMYEGSAKIPMILVPPVDETRLGIHQVDDRLTALRDVMPTLLDLCNLPIPKTVEGKSLITDFKREYLCCEHNEDERAVRMIRADEFKLIYYPLGNCMQLFDLKNDPQELHDLSDDSSCAKIRERLTLLLIENLYGTDTKWIDGKNLVGEPDKKFNPRSAREFKTRRGLNSQRGWR